MFIALEEENNKSKRARPIHGLVICETENSCEKARIEKKAMKQ